MKKHREVFPNGTNQAMEIYNRNRHDIYTDIGFSCLICGEDSSPYLFCNKCYHRIKSNAIIVAIGGGNEAAYIGSIDTEDDEFDTDELESEEENEETEENQCLICGSECNGYHFCSDCYTKYLKSRECLLKIKNGTQIELLDSAYPTPYRCEDGHKVRSKSEREIDNYLFKKKIRHIYEKPLYIDNDSSEPIHPDFYLPDLDIYIEHLGMDISNSQNQTYIDQWNYKRSLYIKHKMTVICTHESTDTEDIEAALERKLRKIIRGTINYENARPKRR